MSYPARAEWLGKYDKLSKLDSNSRCGCDHSFREYRNLSLLVTYKVDKNVLTGLGRQLVEEKDNSEFKISCGKLIKMVMDSNCRRKQEIRTTTSRFYPFTITTQEKELNEVKTAVVTSY